MVYGNKIINNTDIQITGIPKNKFQIRKYRNKNYGNTKIQITYTQTTEIQKHKSKKVQTSIQVPELQKKKKERKN